MPLTPATEASTSLRDGAVRKVVKRAGSGPTAQPGEWVRVHYTGLLEANGAVFDSSRGRGDGFTFQLGCGNVIPGWDLGVATMREGEAAVLTIHHTLAYGEARRGVIPPESTLVFEIELLKIGDERTCWQTVRLQVYGLLLFLLLVGAAFAVTARYPSINQVPVAKEDKREAKRGRGSGCFFDELLHTDPPGASTRAALYFSAHEPPFGGSGPRADVAAESPPRGVPLGPTEKVRGEYGTEPPLVATRPMSSSGVVPSASASASSGVSAWARLRSVPRLLRW